MKITVTTAQGAKVYEQLFDDSKTLNATVGFMMEQPLGTAHTVKIENNGHDLVFATQANPTQELLKVANGIVTRKRGTPAPAGA